MYNQHTLDMPSSSASPLAPSYHLSHSRQQSRSASPVRYEIADFQDIHLTHPATARTTRETTRYCPEASPQQDFQGSGDSYRQITNAFLGKLPSISRATNLNPLSTASNYAFPAANSSCSLPPSGASSPTKSLASFITSNTSDTTASKRRTRHTSKSVIDSWFNGTSAPINVGILPSPARSEAPEEQAEEYDIDLAYGNMETAAAASFTRLPPRVRRSRTSTMQSQTSSPGVAAKLGGWFTSKSNNTSPTPKSSQSSRLMEGIAPSDPLLNLDVSTALFPHGPADPLEPNSFNDLLNAAESIISNMQNAYRARCAEVKELQCEISVKDEETEEAETRARHLKMQLEDMAKQVSAQEAKTEVLERMLTQQQRETRQLRRQSLDRSSVSPRRVSLRVVPDDDHQDDVGATNWKRMSRTGASDSGFESDGDNDSVFSVTGSPVSSSASTVDSDAGPAEAAKVRIVRVERGRDAVLSSNVARAYAPIEMRIENQRLRERVLELERAVEGCLDLVSGPLR
ncbi:hypothetical protein FKW77_008961 [Venturia effusa]|uniref:Uncharacterized protein n=1 Tax=Venturia effusa TaxID=50376 RepID=A0A517L3Y5_9PEZI|nr:hypothetical protein FKW77_008961 [Venturia effusa]